MKINKRSNIVAIVIIIIFITTMSLFTSEYSKKHIPSTNSNVTLDVDMGKWEYDSKNNVYYQLKISYCAKPIDTNVQTLGIYVPGEYLNGEKNEDETYSCTINERGTKNRYTSRLAPIIISVNSNENVGQKAPDNYKYSDVKDYIEAGYIYIQPGTRGAIDNNEEYNSEIYNKNIVEGIADLKAVVKFCRFNKNNIPGNHERIFSFGINGGGTKSAIIGASGDSEFYYEELLSNGAILNDLDGNWISDSVNGAMCCSPTLNLEMTEEAYTWNIGQYLNDNSAEEKISNNVANSKYVDYINEMNLKSEDGTLLYLDELNKEEYNNGTYYDYILNEFEISLNQFLDNTTFPYTNKEKNITYKTKEEYIKYLNGKNKWLIREEGNSQIKITSIKDFVANFKFKGKEDIKSTSLKELNPLYFLSDKYDGKGTSYISRYWNIYSDIDIDNLDFSAEQNLKLVLQNNEDVKKVKYTSIWGKEYSLKEKEKLAIKNLNSWLEEFL